MARKRKPDPEKIKRILEKRGYKDGKVPRGKEVHHILPLAEGGRDVPSNIRVLSRAKHKQIHRNRSKRGKI